MSLIAKLVILIQLTFSSLSNRGIFTEGLVGQPSNLTPHMTRQNKIDKDISQILYPQLVKYDLKGDLVPDLADSWKISDNFLEYDFKLRSGVYWSNGREISSDDVIFTAQNSPEIQNVEVKKVNDHEVQFFLKEPFAPFLDLLTHKIIPQEARIGLKPTTLAKHKIVRIVRSGERIDEIIIQANSNIKDGIKFIRFKFYNQQTDLETAAMLKEVDSLNSTNLNNSGFFGFDFIQRARRYGLFFNLDLEKLSSSDLRRDMAAAINKKELVNKSLEGLGEPMVSIGPAYNPNLNADYHQKITLTVPNEDKHLALANLLKQYWENIGIETKILPLPFWDISTRVIDTKDFEVLLFGQEKGRDPDEYTLWHSSKTRYPGLNISQLNNQRVDEALEKGRREMDPEKRREHYKNFEAILNEEVPATFLYKPIYRWYISQKYAEPFEQYLLNATCCDGCKCKEPRSPELYYPWERFKLLPI